MNKTLLLGVFLLFSGAIIYPFTVNAGLVSIMVGIFGNSATSDSTEAPLTSNSQNLPLLRAAVNVDPNPTKLEQVPVIIDNSSLFAEIDPNGNGTSTPEVFDSSQINIYVVRNGDTLPQIAKTFGVTVNTVVIANDLITQSVKEGQRLIILPVSGIQHTIRSGETLTSIAKSYKLSTKDILQYNNFENSSKLAVGDKIFIPSDAVQNRSSSVKTSSGRTAPLLSSPLIGGVASSVKSLKDTIGYFIEPLVHYRKTQTLHGHNGVDLGASVGEPILAAAGGEIIISRKGWNGGYGNYVVIQHDNGTQTVYGHASKLLVTEGETVQKGQAIALVGSTGESTGPHLHVEVRGGKNPF